MILYIFQCHSPKSSHTLPLPQSPKDCSYKVKNHSALQFLDILPREKRKCVRSDFYTIAYSNIINNGKKVKKKKEQSTSFSRRMDTQIWVYLYSSIFITQKTSNKLLIIKVKYMLIFSNVLLSPNKIMYIHFFFDVLIWYVNTWNNYFYKLKMITYHQFYVSISMPFGNFKYNIFIIPEINFLI